MPSCYGRVFNGDIMEEFNASLVREKIVFIDDYTPQVLEAEEEYQPTVIRSNRIFLQVGKRAATEKIVVRAQNMHTTLRLAGRMLYNYSKQGLFLDRETPYDWEAQWESIMSHYERDFNPDLWGAIYINGKPVFKTTTSPFVDVIEKCALLTIDNYDATMDVTENALKQVGRAMRINHSSNVATVITDSGDSIRCGIIHRGGKDTTFSFTAEGGETKNRIVQTFSIAAAFLEAINLRFILDGLQERKRMGEIPNVSKEANKIRIGTARLVSLDKGIRSFEDIYSVRYRPDKPKFFNV